MPKTLADARTRLAILTTKPTNLAAIPVVKRGISYHYFFAHVFFRVSYNRLPEADASRGSAPALSELLAHGWRAVEVVFVV